MKFLHRLKQFALLLALSATLGFSTSAIYAQDTSETLRQLDLFGSVFEKVKAEYVEDVEDKDLIEAAINGMLTSLDPHSAYLNADGFKDMRIQTKGEFGGLGIEVTMENGLVKVVSPIDDTPAFRAGMQSGDLISRIDEEDVMGMTLSDAVDKMRGIVGTEIVLEVLREGEPEPLQIRIIRDVIKINAVRSRLEKDVGYIRITTFNEQVETNLEKAISDLQTQAETELKGLVLDLRNNPGGLLDQAIFVSDAFLNAGEIVSTRGRHEEDTRRTFATEGDLINGLPIVVLINGGSASASEIVAGALQDHKRAVVMGTKSFGKGSVQTIMSMGIEGAIRITTARYYTPSGRSIQAEGIEPDILVEPAKLEKIDTPFYLRREADLRGALENGKQQEDRTKELTPTDERKDVPEDTEDKTAQDYQLLRALDLIRGIARYRESLN